MKNPSSTHRNQLLRRPKQRRQQQLLEVRLRADKERERQIMRAAGIIFKVVLVAALCVGAWVGTKQALRRLVWENRMFYLTDIRVTTDGTLTREQVLATGGIVEGRNILLLSPGKVRTALDALPQVEHVTVHRVFPNRIDVEVTERQPVAWLAAPGDTDPIASERSFLIDARGYVMKAAKLLPDYYSLPTITGVETGNIVPGRRITAPAVPSLREPDGRMAVLRQEVTAAAVQASLDLIRLNADSTRWQVRNIDVSKGYCLAVTDRSRAVITFGLDNLDKQLTHLYRLLDVIEPAHKEIQTINLFVERNIPVTFVEPVAEEAGPPAPGISDSPKPGDKSAPAKDKSPKDKAAASPAPGKKSKSKDSDSSPPKRSGVEALKKRFRP